MSYSEEVVKYHTELVREVIAMNPNSTGHEAIKYLKEKTGIELSHWYILKLRKKVVVERVHRYDRAAVLVRIAEMEDRVRKVHAEMWAIVMDQKAPRDIRIKAATLIAKSDKELFDAQLDAGVFERKIGTVDISPDLEKFSPVLKAFANFGLIKEAKVIDVKPNAKRAVSTTN